MEKPHLFDLDGGNPLSKPSLSLLFSLLLIATQGCASDPKPRGFVPSKDQPISVQEFSLEDAEVNYAGAYEVFGMDIAESIASRLDALGHNVRTVRIDEEPASGSVLIAGRIIRLDRGNRALRYVGFGAGKAWLIVAGEVRDSKGIKVAQFSTKRYAAAGLFGGSAERSIRRCIEAVASEIANMVRHGTYRQLVEVALDPRVTGEAPPQAPTRAEESDPEVLPFSACFERCLELTDRTREECFDACSGR